ncbi:MAG: T9SS type A sorting domain-containing protein [Ignavibacteriaceae bacterium]|nr:T9SS type A sorting domain-containing protein [Ignavibacteriaceae bacterium]
MLPNGLPQYPRIYAVLDQDNSITEIHEDNNKGFSVLGASSVSGVDDEINIIPEDYVLYQSYPNPFNPSTTIKYSVPNDDNVSLKVFDILGREVELLVDEYKNAGTYSIEFNASRFASGVYFYQLQSGRFIETKKMILLR